MSVKAPAKGHTAKHVTARKHHAAKKHAPVKAKQPVTAKAKGPQVHTVAKHPAQAKPRGFAVAEWLPVCAFEAVAMWLRLAGQRVTGDDVAGLWELYGEATVPEALDAFSLSGFGPVKAESFGGELGVRRGELAVGLLDSPVKQTLDLLGKHALILGVDVPGPHAVLATVDGWWSWGELHSPWTARIEEAWQVAA